MASADPAIVLTLPDGSERQVPAGTTPLEVARSIGPGLARAAVGAIIQPATARERARAHPVL